MKMLIGASAGVLLLTVMFCSVASAALTIDVSVESPQILPLQNQVITATTNERGIGLLFVIQPNEGISWSEALEGRPVLRALWNRLPDHIQAEIAGRIGSRIVSFDIIRTGLGGGSVASTFPEDFEGVNGDPSTGAFGTYIVIFAFRSFESDSSQCCRLCEISFDCASWDVMHAIPEVPFGTIVSLLSMIIALPVLGLFRTRRFR